MLVSGRLSVDTYTDKENRKQTGVEIVALDVQFLDQKPKEDKQAVHQSLETAEAEAA